MADTNPTDDAGKGRRANQTSRGWASETSKVMRRLTHQRDIAFTAGAPCMPSVKHSLHHFPSPDQTPAFAVRLHSMKLIGLVLASTVSSSALASARPAAVNASMGVSSNLSHAILGNDPLCNMTPDGAQEWWYNTRSDGPHYCHGPLYQEWSMLRAYRSGGTANVHWKYTDDKNDRECLLNWKYYAEDGKQLIATVSGRITRERDSRTWCALPVYRSGGVQTYQWDRCWCLYDGIGGH